ncbi:Na+/H+ antiporter subunit G [Ovoidimarina sediminis]|uniref:Na+/H+ antiporter subunit G n=1 Tax=Ovoidimarina sediminis TaxID=3079856 RepID=UPI0029071E67|nr:Na+/H+ antiporter subunit G [Rhodophyticola sp. MJ-SS7]MDU8944769.1 Na+/H+ antiporter subunit G [Rhodophyticola sp. MJ-SS7]
MTAFTEILITAMLVISGLFGLVGSYGLIKLKNTVQRLHAPTKATTLGIGGVLIASMIFFYAKTGHISLHELLITLFLFLTAPITANFIAKAYLARNVSSAELPDRPSEYGWSVYDDPPENRPSTQ